MSECSGTCLPLCLCSFYSFLCSSWHIPLSRGCFPIILCSVHMFLVPFFFPCSVPFLALYDVCWFLAFIVSLCSVSGLPLFRVASEYLQIFLGIPDTGILLYTTRYQCNMPWFTMTLSQVTASIEHPNSILDIPQAPFLNLRRFISVFTCKHPLDLFLISAEFVSPFFQKKGEDGSPPQTTQVTPM